MTLPPPLTPYPLSVLLGRIAHEWETRGRILDLPSARIWSPDPGVDLSFDFMGRRAATPVGPAAGPHSQMAQNIILSWLGGARFFELKTVQVLDELEINRPCIDMQTIGFNIEWSQELKVSQSLEEYVKAWMAIEVLRNWEPLVELIGPEPGDHIFDMSVGYDLAGISGEKVANFISSMIDAGDEIERLRSEIPKPFPGDLDFQHRIADTITLSTFHGCPPDEIESIVKHLMTRHRVDVIVKLNPTLLGLERVGDILGDSLGYSHIVLDPEAFEHDLAFDRAVTLIGDLREFARSEGREFGIKLTNTLVVRNTKGFLPDDPMYLSGPPLHALAVNVADALIAAMPGVLRTNGQDGDVQMSFSAGVGKENLAATLGMGAEPVTMCSDLLKPGGYGRLAPMLRRLTEEMRSADASDLVMLRDRYLAQSRADGFRDPVEARAHAVISGEDGSDYHLRGNSKLPRSVDHILQMWGCVACNFCVTVCPNDAFFRLPTPPDSGLDGRQQYFVLAELCNECGNCMVFCPEDGDPAQVKPKLYLERGRFDASDGQGFLITSGGVVARPGFEGEVPLLTSLLEADEGLPLRLSDLV